MAAQAQDFVRELDKKTDKVVLRGKITFDDIRDESIYKWFENGSKGYEPDADAIEGLRRYSGNYRFVVFAGMWCEDTWNLLPKFHKVLKEAHIDMNAVVMYGVNRRKEALNIEHLFYNIKSVPTIIVMMQQREVGRIIESVNKSMEADLLSLIEKDALEMERKKAAKQ